MLKDNADKISGDDKSKIEGAVNAVKEALKGSDTAAIKAAAEKLNEASQAVWRRSKSRRRQGPG